jgi:hypothetical protein
VYSLAQGVISDAVCTMFCHNERSVAHRRKTAEWHSRWLQRCRSNPLRGHIALKFVVNPFKPGSSTEFGSYLTRKTLRLRCKAQSCLGKQSLFIVRTIWNPQIYKNSVRTSQETHHVSATEPNRLMLFRETVAVYCENHTEHTDI